MAAGMTLLDYAASQKENRLIQGFINTMLDDDSPGGGMGLLAIMEWMDMDSLSAVYAKLTNEGSPNPTSRPIGGTYNAGLATLKSETVNVGNVGQDVMIDRAYTLKTKNYLAGANPREFQTKMLAERINRYVNNMLMNGNKAVNPFGFNGLRYYCDSRQVIDVSTKLPNYSSYTNGLNIWSSYTAQKGRDFMTGLDYLVNSVGSGGKRVLIMNDQAKRALQQVVRDSGSTSSFYKITEDSYNRTVETWRDCEIIDPGAKAPVETLEDALDDDNMVLPNNYTFGTAENATEIYCVKIGTDGVMGLQYNGLDVRTVADEMTQGPAELIRADWYPSMHRFKPSAVAKMTGVIVL